MNPPLESRDDMRCAEYVLGVLNAVQRRAVETDMAQDPRIAAAVDAWQNRLVPMTEDIAPVAPPTYLWSRILAELGLGGFGQTAGSAAASPAGRNADANVNVKAGSGWWHNLAFWRSLGIGATALAAVLTGFALLPTLHQQLAPVITGSENGSDGVREGQYAYRTATIAGASGNWTATIDLQRATMIVVPLKPAPAAANRSNELWLIPAGGKPIPVGLLATDRPTAVPVPADLMAYLQASVTSAAASGANAEKPAVLAISREPAGGSPTGQPTGPILGTGAVTGI